MAGQFMRKKRFRTLLSHIPLSKKLRIYLGIVLFMVILLSGLLLVFLWQTLSNDIQEQMESTGEHLRSELLSRLSLQHTLLTQLMGDSTIRNFVGTDYSSCNTAYRVERAKVDLSFARVYELLPSAYIGIYANNPTVVTSNEFIISLEQIMDYPWVDERVQMDRNTTFWAIGYVKNNLQHLMCYKSVSSNEKPYDTRMVVSLGVRLSDLKTALFQTNGGYRVLLVGDTGEVLLSHGFESLPENMETLIGDEGKTGFVSRLRQLDGGTHIMQSIMVNHPDLDILGWRLLLFRPLSGFFDGMLELGIIWVAVSAAVFTLLLAFTRTVSGHIVDRTDDVVTHIGRIAAEDYSYESELVGSDEFSRISDDLNALSRRLQDLIDNEYKSKIEIGSMQIEKQRISLMQQETEIISLQNQINPHYFFNTLESIRMNLLIRGDEESSEIVQFFAESLQTYSKAPYGSATLREELAFLEKYIRLQSYCFSEKIDYRIEAEESLLDCRVPPFFIQPILENSVIHGLETKNEPGHIGITARPAGDDMEIRVTDNGVGMSPEQLDELNQRLVRNEISYGCCSIGLVNVNRRLKLLYGEGYGVSLTSQLGRGTESVIRIPIVFKDPEGSNWNGIQRADR